MPSFADWQRADIIAALALAVSVLAFLASAASAFAAWRTYLSGLSDRLPRLRGYFEPLENSETWWLLRVRIHNRSPFDLSLEQISITTPWRAAFSEYLGPYVGGSSGGGPTHYSLPDGVKDTRTSRTLSFSLLADTVPLEIDANQSTSEELLDVFVRVPRWTLCRYISFKISLRELSSQPKSRDVPVHVPFPTKQSTPARY